MTTRAAEISVKYSLILHYLNVSVVRSYHLSSFIYRVVLTASSALSPPKPNNLVDSVEFIYQTASDDHNETIMGLHT